MYDGYQGTLKVLVKRGLNGNMFYLIKNFLLIKTIKVRGIGHLFNNYEFKNEIPRGLSIIFRLAIITLNEAISCIKKTVNCTIFDNYLTKFLRMGKY